MSYTTKNKLSGKIKSRSHERRCKWKNCRREFLGTEKQDFCSKKCMYEWRKNKNWEILICPVCDGEFRERKNYRKNGKKRMFCSNECNRSSDYKKEKLREWGFSDANPRKSQAVKDKIKQTKLERYGNENYNNPEQTMKTTMERYGVHAGFMINPSNGKRISKGQRQLYEEVKKEHSDALLEHWLSDVQKSVDIFIPSLNKIIEYYGIYWHADPKKYKYDYYNKVVKMTAEEIWKRDGDRERELMGAGYKLQIEWEK